MRQHQVVAMAIVARGSYDQSGLKKPAPVYTLGVVLHNVVLGHVIYPGNHFSFPVASSAKKGYVHFIGAGVGVGIMKNIVIAVTLLAAGGVGIIHEQGLSVHSPLVI
jgi:hypothetical protein